MQKTSSILLAFLKEHVVLKEILGHGDSCRTSRIYLENNTARSLSNEQLRRLLFHVWHNFFPWGRVSYSQKTQVEAPALDLPIKFQQQ